MTKRIQLLDHNVERAYGLTVGLGRFKNSVRFQIDGTVGHFTVNASDLIKAVQEVASGTAIKNEKERFESAKQEIC